MIRNNRTDKKFAGGADDAKTMAACLNRILKKVDEEGLSEEAATELADDIKLVTDRFRVSPKAAVLLAFILEKSNSSNVCDEEDMAHYIGCTNIEFFGFHDALRELEDSGVVNSSKGRRKSFNITPETGRAVEKDCEFQPRKNTGLTNDELFTRFRIHISDLRHDIIDSERFLEEMDKLLESNRQLLFCRKCLDSPLYTSCTPTERRMFLYMCHRLVSHSDQSVPIDILMNLTAFMEDEQCIKRHISLEDTAIQKEGLVCFGNEDGFINTNNLALSDSTRSEFLAEIELPPSEKVMYRNLISWETIKEQPLYYNKKEGEQIARLESLLGDENFRKVQERLESQGMPKGFSIVFHGTAGSGKTATLYALARKTHRDLFWVDLSSIKSKWVGDSEKQVKNLFDTYRKLVKTSARAPILAVNEADAIFTKRISNPEDSVDQMNNAITDIILNELETLDGILIATTNLVGNMMGGKDNAMERRFLFKVEFSTPGEDIREKIWKAKLTDLTDSEAAVLASRFAFSGGNIENVARKSTVEFVLSGERPPIDALVQFCEEENVIRKKERSRIGF